jgi:hypothetical protein
LLVNQIGVNRVGKIYKGYYLLILIQVGMYSDYPDLLRVIIVFVIHRQGMYKTNLIRDNGYRKVAIISGTGVRGYYRRLVYQLVDTYMLKDI